MTELRVAEWGEPTGQPVLQHWSQTVPTGLTFHRHTVTTCSAHKMATFINYAIHQTPRTPIAAVQRNTEKRYSTLTETTMTANYLLNV